MNCACVSVHRCLESEWQQARHNSSGNINDKYSNASSDVNHDDDSNDNNKNSKISNDNNKDSKPNNDNNNNIDNSLPIPDPTDARRLLRFSASASFLPSDSSLSLSASSWLRLSAAKMQP